MTLRVVLMAATSNKCSWTTSELLENYHDNEWGIPLHDNLKLFEMLILEGHQAGLSWEIILKRRKNLRSAYFNFDPNILKNLTNEDLNNYLTDNRVIKNRLKIKSVRDNAIAYFKVLEKHNSFNDYIWSFTNYKPIINNWQTHKEIPAKTELSEKISKDLKKYGFKFVGPTIIYAFMQAVGIVNDHLITCDKRK